MAKIVKITIAKPASIRPGACPNIEILQDIEIPPYHYGEFYIRRSLAEQGLNAPNCIFHEGWSGRPKITLAHVGANDVDLYPNQELGELHIRYDPPSPVEGEYAQNYGYHGVRLNEEGQIELANAIGMVFIVEESFFPDQSSEMTGGFKPLDKKKLTTSWSVNSVGSFEMAPYMINYKFSRYLTRQETDQLKNLLLGIQLNGIKGIMDENQVSLNGTLDDHLHKHKE